MESEAKLKTLYFLGNLQIALNKIECFLLAGLSSLWVRSGVYPKLEHLKGAKLR
jgi:hypothetical protein